ncbi:single-stranded DNA-binding protein [Pyrodictium delaneyi]|uniref:Single-stranded DNA-binding protein n=1 Tax=Pyrodictium delaneyi TaxID=1273541 RepID=A0A0P0N597_9CREN|nr:OB-fold nucleic acid binding domain-containing protein [Pyrodictium delaneyi]ALL01600.1 single-stranded DNA-binding protein [Pyrodictium delaneyi]OWJ55159.1 single-stranded DNA-binding protein [Pyrodictium delaneyi]
MSESVNIIKISDLKPGMNNVNIRVRVLEAEAPRTINTRRGPRTISEAVVGDETGRTRLTLWGHAAGSLQAGDTVMISGAWTTSYRGQVVLNIGGRGNITRVDDTTLPPEDEIPEETPQVPPDWRPPRRNSGFGGPRRRSYRQRF